ncbi:hypothetical protein Tco_1390145 [Tanacetum coccineum]
MSMLITCINHGDHLLSVSVEKLLLWKVFKSRAQILWGMYHNKNVDYVYLLWKDLVYQVENKNSKKNNDMHYPRFTKVIKKVESSPKTKPTQASKGKRIKTSSKGVIPAKKKQSATKSKGLAVLSDVALTEAEQMKIALKRSKTQQHNSHASGLSADEGTGVTPGFPDVPSYDSKAEQISWKSSDKEDDDEVNMGNDNDDDVDNQDDVGKEYDKQDDDDQEHDGQDDEEQDDVNEQTDSDNNGDDFVHPKLSTHDEEDKKEEDSDPRVHTPSNYESIDDEESDEEIQGANVEGEEMDEEETNEEDEANELYRDVNVNLEGRDTEMTDAPRTIIQTTQVIEDTHVIITPVNSEAQPQSSFVSFGFVSNMLNLVQIQPPLLSTTTLPPPTTPLITHLQQTPIPTPATAPSSSLQDLPNFGSLFGFDHRLRTLEIDFSELKQTNQFDAAVSSIPGTVDAYLANKMHEAVKIAV